MLEPKIREIAIQAMAANVRGGPVEVAGEMLKGISALDYPGKPFVVWPKDLPVDEQIEALELELKRVRHSKQAVADWRALLSRSYTGMPTKKLT